MPDKYLLYTAGNYKKPSTGGEKRFLEFLNYLLERKDEIILLAPGDINILGLEKIRLIPVKTYRSKYVPSGLLNYLFNLQAFRKAKRSKPDVTILFSFPYGIQGVLAKLPNIALLIRENFFEWRNFQKQGHSFFERIVRKALLGIEGYTFKRVKKIIVQTNYEKNSILQRHKKIAESIESKISILPNNVNPSWIKRKEPFIKNESLVQPAIKNGFHFIYLGNINTEGKGLHILLRAFSKLLEEKSNVRLSILGEGKLKKFYQELYGEAEKIEFCGYQKNPEEYLSTSDLLIVPSLADSFPNTLLEGLYLQIPSIGANRGGIPEILQYSDLLFEPDVESLYEKMKEIIDNNLFESYRKKAIERKEALTFDWAKELRAKLL